MSQDWRESVTSALGPIHHYTVPYATPDTDFPEVGLTVQNNFFSWMFIFIDLIFHFLLHLYVILTNSFSYEGDSVLDRVMNQV